MQIAPMPQRLSFFLLAFLFLSAPAINAQDATTGPASDKASPGSVIVIPFEAKMLLSDINRLLGSRYQLSLDQIRDLLRHEAAASFQKTQCTTARFSAPPLADLETRKQLNALYGAGRYKQEIMEGRAKELPIYEEAVLAEGEIKRTIEFGHKYMAFAPEDTARLRDFAAANSAFRLLFITQMDIRNTTAPESGKSATGYLLRFHFSLFDSRGLPLSGGAVNVWMPLDERVDLLDNLRARIRDLAEMVLEVTGLCGEF
jgi:hypothetical protein